MTPERLHPDDLRQLAELIVAGLRDEGVTPADTGGLVDVRTVARALDVSPDFVYQHARELGGLKLTGSPKSPWRFSLERAREAMASRTPPPAPPEPPSRRRARKPKATSTGVPLLPVGGKR